MPTAQAQATDYPLSLTNCGQTITFDAAPDSAVTMGQSGTEMLYALGLGKKIVATSVWFNPVLPQFKELNDSIERLADNFPSFESVVTKKPGQVVAQFESLVADPGRVAPRVQFPHGGLPTSVLPADCAPQANPRRTHGTRVAPLP